jgi:hypothetical protein
MFYSFSIIEYFRIRSVLFFSRTTMKSSKKIQVFYWSFFTLGFWFSFFGDLAEEEVLLLEVGLVESETFCHSIGLLRYIGHGGNVNCYRKTNEIIIFISGITYETRNGHSKENTIDSHTKLLHNVTSKKPNNLLEKFDKWIERKSQSYPEENDNHLE